MAVKEIQTFAIKSSDLNLSQAIQINCRESKETCSALLFCALANCVALCYRPGRVKCVILEIAAECGYCALPQQRFPKSLQRWDGRVTRCQHFQGSLSVCWIADINFRRQRSPALYFHLAKLWELTVEWIKLLLTYLYFKSSLHVSWSVELIEKAKIIDFKFVLFIILKIFQKNFHILVKNISTCKWSNGD